MSKITKALVALETELNGKPAEWGVDDCTAVAVRFVRDAFDVDLDLPDWSSEQEARALIAEAGSLLDLWQSILGYPSPGDPERGDVGIIDMGKIGPVGMICAGHSVWGWRTETGWTWRSPRPVQILAHWRVR